MVSRRRAMMRPQGAISDIIYQLAQSTSFNGSSDYIDTGIKLAEHDSTFTIALSVMNGSLGNDATIFHDMKESAPYPGLSLQRRGSPNTIYAFGGQSNVQTSVTGTKTANGSKNSFVIRHTLGESQFYIDSKTDGVRNSQTVVSNSGTFKTSDKNLLVGCYQQTNGTKGRFWKGTMYDFAIYNRVFTNTEVDEYMSARSD